MKNAEKFRKIFKEFATEVWAFPEKDFLTWLNAEYEEPTIRNCFGCKYSKDNHNSGTEECHLCMWENQYTPTTKNDLGVDCISRKAAEDITWQDPSYTDPLNILTEVRDKIRELPSVTPQEPRKGHWIVQPSNKEQGERDFIWWKCSKCGQVIFSETEHDRLEFHAFCGRCGADMREVKE